MVIRMERLEYDNRSVTLNQTKLTIRIFGLHNFPGNVSTLCSWVLLKKYLYKYSIIRTKMRYSIKFCPSYIPWPPIFKRNVMANESETVNMVILESQFLDTKTVLKKLPNISPEEIPEIMRKKALEDKWTPSDEEEMVNEEG